MIKFPKRLIIASFSCLFALTLSACGSGGSQESSSMTENPPVVQNSKTEPQKVTFGVLPDSPPFHFKENGKLTGFEVEIIEWIAEHNNLEIEWKEMKFDGIIPGLQANQLDGGSASFFVREERKKVMDFTTPYYKSGLSMAVRKDSPIKSVEDLKGKTIVAKQGSGGLDTANKLAEKYGAKVRILQDEPSLFLEVENGNSDALIQDYPTIAYKIKLDGDKAKLHIVGEKLSSEDVAIGIAKGNSILEIFNKGIEEIKATGEYDKMYSKWFGNN